MRRPEQQPETSPNADIRFTNVYLALSKDIEYANRKAATAFVAAAGGVVLALSVQSEFNSLPVTSLALGLTTGLFYSHAIHTRESEYLTYLSDHLKTTSDFQSLRDAVEASRDKAPPESQSLRVRLQFMESRRKYFEDRMCQISELTPDERRKKWRSLETIPSELHSEADLTSFEVEKCMEFLQKYHSVDDRYLYLQIFAGHEDARTRAIHFDDKELQRERDLLQKLRSGLIGPTQVTLFDVMRASERIRQRRMDIQEYRK